MASSIKFRGIDRIVYGVRDMAAGARFFDDWGLKKISSKDPSLLFSTLDGTEAEILPIEDPSLPEPIEDGSTLREVIWGVETLEDLKAVQNKLESEPSYTERDGRPACIDPNGFTISFRITRRTKVLVEGAPINTFAQPNARVNQGSAFYDRAEPIEIGHVVFFANDVPSIQKFYMEKLGFSLSDTYPGTGAFLRCRSEGGHHNMFVLDAPNRGPGLNHVAFTVRDIHEVFGGGLHIDRCGWKTQIGPGRHPVSSAYFWYVENPCGGLAEYFADEDYLTDEWVPREIERTNENYAEWGIGGGIDGHTRRQRYLE